ncbi:MAG: RNA 2',3'-cyclic phosphodiesterase [Candidatus Margulisbacteria bacterium]|nr:RNA 2',3'-cyclic phosphodiesterase [Candidatus Margulisiibacteriota bacterium]
MSGKKRLFVAVDLPQEVKQEIFETFEPLYKKSDQIKWVEKENYHFTLKFLGGIEEGRLLKIAEKLKEMAKKTASFELYLGSFDFLPEAGPTRVIYLEVGGGEDEINTAAFEVEEAMAGLGVEKEKRKYVAHLTVGRIKRDKGLEELKEGIKKLKGICRTIKVREFVLFESNLTYAGPTYQEIERFELAGKK